MQLIYSTLLIVRARAVLLLPLPTITFSSVMRTLMPPYHRPTWLIRLNQRCVRSLLCQTKLIIVNWMRWFRWMATCERRLTSCRLKPFKLLLIRIDWNYCAHKQCIALRETILAAGALKRVPPGTRQRSRIGFYNIGNRLTFVCIIILRSWAWSMRKKNEEDSSRLCCTVNETSSSNRFKLQRRFGDSRAKRINDSIRT